MRDIDASFSGIVNQLQGDEKAAKKLAIKIIEELRTALKKKDDFEEKARQQERHANHMKKGLDHIARHLNLRLPFYVVGENSVYEILEDGVKENKHLLK